ncbi:MAG: flagellar basal body-associated FliL family protein [Proteobacteria bacterium]|nr:flagellar basal body-associated FliL family protein [Pseudomonadota bacterium]MBU4297249.1 flagellar basal body-associated FliL family protein [Pseudomonadota bacterium]MCG2747700.1 flagellar basal body-associated FliL family protein [Desulfobulbaceae bacterium]
MAEEQAKAGEGTVEPTKKSKKILFIILGAAILLLGAGGYFAYTQFLAPKPPPVEQAPVNPADMPETVGEIVTLEPFVVNLADPRGNRYLKMKISMELETLEAAERVQKVTPKLRDLVIMMLTSLSFEEVMTPEGKLRIRDELLERFNRVTRPDKVKNIYFSEFVVQ